MDINDIKDNKKSGMMDTAGYDLQALLATIPEELLHTDDNEKNQEDPMYILNSKVEIDIAVFNCDVCKFNSSSNTNLILHKKMVHDPILFTTVMNAVQAQKLWKH